MENDGSSLIERLYFISNQYFRRFQVGSNKENSIIPFRVRVKIIEFSARCSFPIPKR